mmetsp:Transcript_64350/g.140083  ORF Transcript_64350/g.140083 Transcript_64350/m.140083 type:complete len:207 (+) Transcript_64350:1634-2254(+)
MRANVLWKYCAWRTVRTVPTGDPTESLDPGHTLYVCTSCRSKLPWRLPALKGAATVWVKPYQAPHSKSLFAAAEHMLLTAPRSFVESARLHCGWGSCQAATGASSVVSGSRYSLPSNWRPAWMRSGTCTSEMPPATPSAPLLRVSLPGYCQSSCKTKVSQMAKKMMPSAGRADQAGLSSTGGLELLVATIWRCVFWAVVVLRRTSI